MPLGFLVIIGKGLAMIAPGAHPFELRQNRELAKADYFVV